MDLTNAFIHLSKDDLTNIIESAVSKAIEKINKPKELPKYMNMSQVMELLDVTSRPTIYRRVEAKELPAPMKIGNRVLWESEELYSFLGLKNKKDEEVNFFSSECEYMSTEQVMLLFDLSSEDDLRKMVKDQKMAPPFLIKGKLLWHTKEVFINQSNID